MNPWLLLSISIVAEICATTALKYSAGFSKLVPSLCAVLGYSLSLYLVSIVFKTLPVGIVYAVWSGVGIVLTALVGFFAFGQKPDLAGSLGMAMIIAGVLIINLFSNTQID